MKPEIKSLWLQALRSGDYIQAKEVLHDPVNDSFCCLGVLCDLYTGVTGDDWQQYTDDEILSEKIANWAGLKMADPVVITEIRSGCTGTVTLSALNDEHEKDFLEIADLIEQQL